jgi:hypothetical protein
MPQTQSDSPVRFKAPPPHTDISVVYPLDGKWPGNEPAAREGCGVLMDE